MTQKQFNKQILEYQADINFYGQEVDDASYAGDYNRLNVYHSQREGVKNQLKEFKEKYPEYVL